MKWSYVIIMTIPDEISKYKTKIVVLGAGGAGNNTITRLTRKKINQIETIGANTDAHDLLNLKADRKILIGNNITAGLGAGGDPQIGEHSALESRDTLRSILSGADILFLTCGLGGGTGTGSLPVIGHIARELGILTVAIVTMPLSEEGLIRWENAQIGLEKIRKKVDTLIVLRNDNICDLYPDKPLAEAFQAGDEILVSALIGLSNLILENGVINLDFSDISMILRDGPNAVIGVGESNSEFRAEEAFKKAISHPLMDLDIDGAQSALVQISGGPNVTLSEARKVIRLLAAKMDPHARIIWGVNVEKALRQTIKVMLIASGLKNAPEPKRVIVEVEKNENVDDDECKTESGVDTSSNIFDIKDSIMATGAEVSAPAKLSRVNDTTTPVFYKILQEEASGDLKKFDRALHSLRIDNDNRKSLLDAKQSCKLLHASAQMFGFDEIGQLLEAIENIFTAVQSRELKINKVILDSITLAMEMVIDLIENRGDGRGETGYIADRLKELKEEPAS